MNFSYNLSQLKPGQRAVVKCLKTNEAMKGRLQDLGLTEHTEVIAIRAADSRKIILKTD